jgi:hypothetical protein
MFKKWEFECKKLLFMDFRMKLMILGVFVEKKNQIS